jgi:hypothetical protein
MFALRTRFRLATPALAAEPPVACEDSRRSQHGPARSDSTCGAEQTMESEPFEQTGDLSPRQAEVTPNVAVAKSADGVLATIWCFSLVPSILVPKLVPSSPLKSPWTCLRPRELATSSDLIASTAVRISGSQRRCRSSRSLNTMSVECQLLLARDLGLVSNELHGHLDCQTTEVKRMLYSFMKKLNRPDA